MKVVVVGGEGFIEIFAWETAPGYSVHLLNYTNPNMLRGWFTGTYPVGPQLVRAELPESINGARVDWCMTPELGPGCGQSAANAWCTSKGFSRATSFNWIVQSAAFRQGDHTLCNGYCGAFTDVTCE